MNITNINSFECTGCMRCVSICPKKCIKSELDEEGFFFPVVDNEKCIDCSICIQTCHIANSVELNIPSEGYAVQIKDKVSLKNSASGGIAYEIAKKIIKSGGVAYGAIYDSDFNVYHSSATTEEQLALQQGSKYVQSDISSVFDSIKKDCMNGKRVLFCGTPCQIAAIKQYLKKDYENLFYLDLICHGVPSPKLFKKYISWKAQRMGIENLTDYRFRDKFYGWGTNYLAESKHKKVRGGGMEEPYFYDFVKAENYRYSCYNCKYACNNRVGDLTIGDFWGVDKLIPGINFNKSDGISCVLVNNSKGQKLLDEIASEILIKETGVEKVIHSNSSLSEPANQPDIRGIYYSTIDSLGFDWSKKRILKTKQFYISWIKRHIPVNFKMHIKKIIGRIK